MSCIENFGNDPNLLGQLGHAQVSISSMTSGGQGCEAGNEEVEPWKGDHVHRQLAQVSVELTRKSQTSGDSRHCHLEK